MKKVEVKSFTRSHCKENKPTTTLAVMYVDVNGKIKTAMQLRVYHLSPSQDGSARVYAAFWTFLDDYASGTGYAGGGGYCKSSAAASEAILNAGFVTDTPTSGRGMREVENALLEIADFYDLDNAQIFTF